MNDEDKHTPTDDPNTQILANEQAAANAEADELSLRAAAMKQQAADLELAAQAAKQKAQAPVDAQAMAKRARNAIAEFLAHRNPSPSTGPEDAAWKALAAFFDSITRSS